MSSLLLEVPIEEGVYSVGSVTTVHELGTEARRRSPCAISSAVGRVPFLVVSKQLRYDATILEYVSDPTAATPSLRSIGAPVPAPASMAFATEPHRQRRRGYRSPPLNRT